MPRLFSSLFATALLLSALFIGRTALAQQLNLPSTRVTFYADGGVESFFDVALSGVPNGFDVQNDIYNGFCVSYYDAVSPTGNFYPALLYDTMAPNLPAQLDVSYWDRINYIINHKQGGRDDIQGAIWFFTDNVTWDLSATAEAIIEDAMAHGEGFLPGPNDLRVVVVEPANSRLQTIIIEVPPPTNPPPAECDDFVTGGGWIVTSSGAKANFGVHGGIRNGSLWGGLNYIDHGRRMHVKSTAVTGYQHVDARTRQITYNVTIDGQPGTAIVIVTDNGEPGTHDIFQIRLSNGYFAAGQLGNPNKRGGGGNIQLHKEKCKKPNQRR